MPRSTHTGGGVLGPIDRLPDRDLHPYAGLPAVDIFLGLGISSFHGACRYVHAMPYGCNASIDDVMVLFADGYGTCFTKHGVIAKLAREVGLPVYKVLGFYRLTDAIITGVGERLRPHGLPFIPQIHCFLEFDSLVPGETGQGETVRVDLTEGNAHGKNTTIDSYDFVVRLTTEPSRDQLAAIYAEHLARYIAIEPRLASLTMPLASSILQSCSALARPDANAASTAPSIATPVSILRQPR